MAIYHFNARTISRSSGRSACAAAAYRAAETIKDERTGMIYDFKRKCGVLHSEIIAPASSPSWATNRSKLWNHAELREEKSTRRATATTAREFNAALPYELGFYGQLALVREFSQYIVETFCVAVDFSIHKPSNGGDCRNFHVHLMLTDRRINEAGFAGKVRELNLANGGRAQLLLIRKRLEEISNSHLRKAGVLKGIDCRSLKSQGVDRIASIHLGASATALERRGIATARGDRNRTAEAMNKLKIIEKRKTTELGKILTFDQILANAKAKIERRNFYDLDRSNQKLDRGR